MTRLLNLISRCRQISYKSMITTSIKLPIIIIKNTKPKNGGKQASQMSSKRSKKPPPKGKPTLSARPAVKADLVGLARAARPEDPAMQRV